MTNIAHDRDPAIPPVNTMHISQKLGSAAEKGTPTFSFEFFPPKTAQVSHAAGVG